ncbi:hypothetical protein WUBG_14921 [Wuchereria bancrofti]|uniref:Uncharacterized protein n=1 Tax=Wuchereria bancrofti TaxID=6293 RepID=J9DWV4_WUCBA|nr:hypothetical protein WUBG_14921 [Wuchereria bancrofti]
MVRELFEMARSKKNSCSPALDENDIVVLKRYGQGAYTEQLKQLESDIEECVKKASLM